MKDLYQQEKQLSQQLIEESFGLEHIFRELSLIWHFNSIDDEERVKYRAIDEEEGDEDKLKLYPEICAEQMLNGTAIQLMDGDTSFIYTRWIQAVLGKLKEKM